MILDARWPSPAPSSTTLVRFCICSSWVMIHFSPRMNQLILRRSFLLLIASGSVALRLSRISGFTILWNICHDVSLDLMDFNF